jgi:hypothetical protein
MTPQEKIAKAIGDISNLIADDFKKDITDRRGFRQTWDGIDEDVRQEMMKAWSDIVANRLLIAFLPVLQKDPDE